MSAMMIKKSMLIKKLYDTVKGINQTDKAKCMNVLNDSDADKEVV